MANIINCIFCNSELSLLYEGQGSYRAYKCSICVPSVIFRWRIRDEQISYFSFTSVYNDIEYTWEGRPVSKVASLICYKDEVPKVYKFNNNVPNITPSNFAKTLPTLLVFI